MSEGTVRRRVATFGVAGVVGLGLLTGSARSQTLVASDNGADPGRSAVSRITLAAAPIGGMSLISSDRGRVSLSMNGLGTLNSSGSISIRKPAGATVRRAVLFAVTTGFQNTPIAGPVTLNGQSVIMGHELASGIRSYNYWSDVTSAVKPTIDSGPAGLVPVSVSEPGSSQVDGTVLAVVFDDPAQTVDQSVGLVFGALQPGGDVFSLALDRPFLANDPSTRLEMSLGISYSCQSPVSCGSAGQQYSTVTVNGQRLTTSAGGEDDGASRNGALITVGGVGDSLDNPLTPLATPTGARSDDELYDLRPFVASGARSITVETTNPSNDDNVFLAAFTGNPPLSITTSAEPLTGVLSASVVRTAGATVGSLYSVTLKVLGAVSGADYEFVVSSGHVPDPVPSDAKTHRYLKRAVNGQVVWTYLLTSPRGVFSAAVYAPGAITPLSSVVVK